MLRNFKNPSTSDYSLTVFVFFILLAVFLFYYYYNLLFPYFVSWDMDLTTTIDSLLIHSNLLPSHFAHTAFGIYFIVNFTQHVANSLGYLSIYNINDLQNSLSPILGVAQLTEFIRMHTPYVIVIFIFFLFNSLYVLYKDKKTICLLMLLLFSTESSILFVSYWVRSELYSIMFWSIALFTSALAVRSNDFRSKIFLLFLSGILSGIAFTTKLQSIFYMATLPLIFILMDSSRNYFSFKLAAPQTLLTFTKKLSYCNLFIFLLLTCGGALINTHHVFTNVSRFGISPALLALSITLVTIIIVNKKNSQETIILASSYLTVLLFGFLLSYFLPLFLYPGNFKISLLHSAIMYKVTMLGLIRPHILSLKSTLSEFTTLYIFLFMTYAYLLYGKIKKQLEIDHIQLIIILLIILMHLGCLLFGIRQGTPRDLIWNQTLPIYLLSMILLVIISTIKIEYLRVATNLTTFILSILIGINCINLMNTFDPIDVYKTFHNDVLSIKPREKPFLHSVYEGNQHKYDDIMNVAYSNSDIGDAALLQAHRFRQLNETIHNIDPYKKTNLRNVSYAQSGFVINKFPFRVIESMPVQLLGSTLILLNHYSTLDFQWLGKQDAAWLFLNKNKFDSFTDYQHSIKNPFIAILKDGKGNNFTFQGIQIRTDNISFVKNLLKDYSDIAFISINEVQKKRS